MFRCYKSMNESIIVREERSSSQPDGPVHPSPRPFSFFCFFSLNRVDFAFIAV